MHNEPLMFYCTYKDPKLLFSLCNVMTSGLTLKAQNNSDQHIVIKSTFAYPNNVLLFNQILLEKYGENSEENLNKQVDVGP